VDKPESATPDGIDDKTIETEKMQARTSDLCLLCGALRPAEGHLCKVNQVGDGSAPISTANWIGVVVGTHYQILSLIGRGGMSTVFKARHQLLKKMVALKILTPQFRVDQQKLLRFQQEAISVGRLDHPNIIKSTNLPCPRTASPIWLWTMSKAPHSLTKSRVVPATFASIEYFQTNLSGAQPCSQNGGDPPGPETKQRHD